MACIFVYVSVEIKYQLHLCDICVAYLCGCFLFQSFGFCFNKCASLNTYIVLTIHSSIHSRIYISRSLYFYQTNANVTFANEPKAFTLIYQLRHFCHQHHAWAFIFAFRTYYVYVPTTIISL